MAQTKVRLNRNGTFIDLNGPEGPTDFECLPNWVTSLSEGGKRWTYRFTDARKEIWSIRLQDLDEAQMAALKSFFYDTVKGPELSFTYTHTDGASYTVRFVDTGLRFDRRDKQTYGTTIHLELTGNGVGSSSGSTSTTTAA